MSTSKAKTKRPSKEKHDGDTNTESPSVKKSPKTLMDMIVFSIRNQPPSATNDNGVSRVAITKFLKHEFGYDKSTLIKNTLKKAVEKGKLIQNGQSFRVAGDAIPVPKMEAKIQTEVLKQGKGSVAENGNVVVVKYEGKLEDGTIFDSSSSFEFTLGAGEVIKGWDQGILSMRVGEKRKLFVPSKLGYGKRGSPPEIPPNADLHFEVMLKEIK
jgi:FKBP-type peptidyl-prolyl cis-trans isomerase